MIRRPAGGRAADLAELPELPELRELRSMCERARVVRALCEMLELDFELEVETAAARPRGDLFEHPDGAFILPEES